jgi:hypothetical protein
MVVYEKLSQIQRLITAELWENYILSTHLRSNEMLSVTQSAIMY